MPLRKQIVLGLVLSQRRARSAACSGALLHIAPPRSAPSAAPRRAPRKWKHPSQTDKRMIVDGVRADAEPCPAPAARSASGACCSARRRDARAAPAALSSCAWQCRDDAPARLARRGRLESAPGLPWLREARASPAVVSLQFARGPPGPRHSSLSRFDPLVLELVLEAPVPVTRSAPPDAGAGWSRQPCAFMGTLCVRARLCVSRDAARSRPEGPAEGPEGRSKERAADGASAWRKSCAVLRALPAAGQFRARTSCF